MTDTGSQPQPPSGRAPRVVDVSEPPETVRAGSESRQTWLARALRGPSEALHAGELVAFPTETVYGLGANARSEEAVRGIFEAKQRPPGHPLIVHVAAVETAKRCVSAWPSVADRLADAFWPGPLTMILPRSAEIPGVVTGGLQTVGCRWPAHEVANALIAQADVPVAAPSANRHKGVSPTTADHVLRSLGGRIDWVVDGGATSVGIESTVVDLTGEHPVILRPGDVTRDALMDVVGDAVETIEYGDDVDDAPSPGDSRVSPGLASTHYAPEAELVVGTEDELGRVRARLYDEAGGELMTVGWVACGGLEGDVASAGDEVIELPRESKAYAQALYATLHRLDALGVGVILVERPPESDAWRAVRNRLGRAADRICGPNAASKQ